MIAFACPGSCAMPATTPPNFPNFPGRPGGSRGLLAHFFGNHGKAAGRLDGDIQGQQPGLVGEEKTDARQRFAKTGNVAGHAVQQRLAPS